MNEQMNSESPQQSQSESKFEPQFESWGRYPRLESRVEPLFWMDDFPRATRLPLDVLAVGMGRSYGDVCLLEDGTLLSTRRLDRFIHFDSATGLLRCESGTTLAEILRVFVPRGWFLPVTPGTKYITLGGAIANDVHGKNHHVAGSFGNHVPRFELARSDGSRMICSPEENAEMYAATIGGMGLTGLITWAEVRLRPIASRRIRYDSVKFHGIDEFLALAGANRHAECTMAWIDCISGGRNFARGIYMLGDHSEVLEPMKPSRKPRLSVPFDFPRWVLNRYSMRTFNELYYRKQFRRQKSGLVDYEPFFYPLDGILHWNRIYGKRGFLQFQCVVPWKYGRDGIEAILQAISESGLASFLAVLKVMGEVPSRGIMSFPQPGITLALDLVIEPEITFPLFNRLAEMTRELGGRLYPAKDARMTGPQFRAFYPEWEEFASHRDPAFTSAFWQRVTADA
jgi:FAD/FMN-containing dehydrogenase